MARYPDWFARLEAIQEVLRWTEVEDLGRKEIKAIFGCSERDSIRLLHKFGAEDRENALSLPRSALLVQLGAIRSGTAYGAFLRQRQDVARHLAEAREETAARHFRVRETFPEEPRTLRFQDLPRTITLRRAEPNGVGRFEILYTDGADLMRQLADFLAIAGVNRERSSSRPRNLRMPPAGSPTSLPYEQFQHYEGPLDLLLDEVRRQNVEIEKIAMAPIVARFLDYVGSAATRNLNLDIDWLHMAATLIHWKSESLLPREPARKCETDIIRDSLVQKLLAHSRLTAEELDRRQTLEQGRFSRTDRMVAEEAAEATETLPLSVWDMVQQARELARWVGAQREGRRLWHEFAVEPDDVTVYEMMEYLQMQLSLGQGSALDGTKLLRDQSTPSRQACLLLGILEMARQQTLQLEQEEPFGALMLSPR